MKLFAVQYSMRMCVDQPVHHHFFSFRCLPKTTVYQQPSSAKVLLDAEYYSYSHDCFGNHFIYGYTEDVCTELDLLVQVKVRVDRAKADCDGRLHTVFCLETEKTACTGALSAFALQCRTQCAGLSSGYEQAVWVMKAVHASMQYQKGSTAITTAAADAFGAGRGVCQDYAQIMISVLRSMHIPARYVAGFMAGEPLTHAWVDVFADGAWRGLDPTNDTVVDDRYIVLSWGRDYADCLVNRGIFYSPEPVRQTQDVSVRIEDIT